MIKDNLAHTHGLRSHLDQLILLDILQALFQTHHRLRDDTSLLVGTRGTYVGQLLGLADIHHKVVVVNMLTNHLTGIHILTWIDEELATVLQLVDGVRKGITRVH